MKIRSHAAASRSWLLVLAAFTVAAQAADLEVLSAIGMQPVMEDLVPKFERASGHKISIAFPTLGQAVKRVQDGEHTDFVIIPRAGIEGFIRDGRTAAAKVAVVAYSSMGVAVRKGAPKPDISTAEAFKRTLLGAKSITYGNPATGGSSGAYMVKVLDHLGIADEMRPKTILLPKPGLSTQLVANGEVELTVNQVQELVAVPGVDVVGPVPRELQQNTVFWGAVMNGTQNPEAAGALLDFLRTPEAVTVIKMMGMEPAAP